MGTSPGTAPELEQQEDESNLWYGRFVRFCLYGPARSLDQCYRDAVGDDRAAKGRARPRADARAPGAWKKIVKEFDWWDRAAEWDKEQRRKALEAVQEALDLARNHAVKAMQFQIDLMEGKVKPAEGIDITHRRLASNSLLNRAGAVHDVLQADEEDGEVQVVGIRIHSPGGGPDSHTGGNDVP